MFFLEPDSSFWFASRSQQLVFYPVYFQGIFSKEHIMNVQHTTAAGGIARAIRQLTVGYVRKRHENRKTRETRRYTRHAALSLNGDWLEQAGFPVGTQVRVSVSPGKLVIENLELAPPVTGSRPVSRAPSGSPEHRWVNRLWLPAGQSRRGPASLPAAGTLGQRPLSPAGSSDNKNRQYPAECRGRSLRRRLLSADRPDS